MVIRGTSDDNHEPDQHVSSDCGQLYIHVRLKSHLAFSIDSFSNSTVTAIHSSACTTLRQRSDHHRHDVEHIDTYTESVRVMGKGRKERIVPVGAPALRAIQHYRHAAGTQTGPLFLNKTRGRIGVKAIWSMLKKCLTSCHPFSTI